MEPKTFPHPFQDERFAYQVKWDGVRILAFYHNGRLRLQNRRLHDRTLQYPELHELPQMVKADSFIIDGEAIVLGHDNRPSFPLVIQRDFAHKTSQIAWLSRTIPVTFAVFDILYLGNKSLLDTPWEERQTILRDIMTSNGTIYLVDNFDDGISLFSAVKANQLEGIVAKRRDSPYIPGKKSTLWLKVKNRRQQLCAIGGLTLSSHRFRSLLIGLYHDNLLYYVGRVSAGLTERELYTLGTSLEKVDRPPFVNPPRLNHRECMWVNPTLTVLIEFLEWTPDLKLRAPVVRGFSLAPPREAVFYR